MSITFQRQFSDVELRAQAKLLKEAQLNAESRVLVAAGSHRRAGDDELFWAGQDACEVLRASWGDISLNVSNSNAFSLLVWLGFNVRSHGDPIWGSSSRHESLIDPFSGSLDAQDLVARILLACEFASDKDQGSDTIAYKGDAGATFVECGRQSGYFTGRAKQLLLVAQAAADADQRVMYG